MKLMQCAYKIVKQKSSEDTYIFESFKRPSAQNTAVTTKAVPQNSSKRTILIDCDSLSLRDFGSRCFSKKEGKHECTLCPFKVEIFKKKVKEK